MRMRLTRIAVAIALLPAALPALGCGDDDSGGDSAAPPTAPPAEADVPTDAEALKAQCVDELMQVGQSEEEAERTCTVPDEAEVDQAVADAVESCLAVAEDLPAGDVRDQAMQDCRDSAE
jgi:hypothetical protein